MTILTVEHLCIGYPQQPIIEQLSFQLHPNQRLMLQGEIGTGKTTLLHCLLGFIPFQQGSIKWFGKNCRQEADFEPLRGTIGICFQQPDDQLFGPTVLDDVAFGPLNQGLPEADAYRLARLQLAQLGIESLCERSVNQLSGGEKNFTALAGVLAMQPKVLLLDEPTNGLDHKNIDKLTALLKSLDLPMLIASHDRRFSRALADDYLPLAKR
ncbi:cobalt ABC transporter ATP-binding protein [[Actinobacillus] muris]|uniref:Cobalt ABC transporter ATP-binding protein n=1 Tax=Muribacter muris TaxID=67855 RepID=A0A0J5P6K7_9PAST|nr:energy-coupling factor ABC transporter ATP-binding protein [Muribacter muris]KMK52018.1 cobalt ABC transporter ATP-binding protein [[Actinobacillus] muris] [Muribacter muris]